MKIAYSWLRQFINTPLSPQEISIILTNIGLEVEHLEEVQAIKGGLEGLVIGHVLTAEPHPNADRLKITTVDIGLETPLQIVCGAANVVAGLKVVVAPVGCFVHPIEGEAFKINTSKIRGSLSEGMICAEDEIGLGKAHDGIMELPLETPIGILAKTYFNLHADFVFEIGLTPNRADAASHLGVARDLAAFLKTSCTLPDIASFNIEGNSQKIEVIVENTEKAPRYAGICIQNIAVKNSPEWLQQKLISIGLRPINNVVDVSNYVLHELGQPLHAFDLAKISGQKIIVKTCEEGTLFSTLDGQERKISAQDLMICDAEKPMCIAGVYGGLHSGVSAETTEIFLESAYFNPVSVRKTSKSHGLKTDASFRFERGTDPDMVIFALKRAALLIKEIAGGTIASEIVDFYPNPIKPVQLQVSYQEIQQLIGKQIPEKEIKAIIEALQIKVLEDKNGCMSLEIPTFKVDVTRPCDITEEVLRIYGYNQIEIPNKINASLSTSPKPDKETVQHLIADMLSANGFYEVWCNSLTKSSYSSNIDQAVKMLNPLSRDLDVMRQNLLFPMLEVVSYNQKHKISDLKLYEFGKTYHLIEGRYVENEKLMLLISGQKAPEQWNIKTQNSDFYQLKSIVDSLMQKLNIGNFEVSPIDNDPNFSFGLKYHRGEKVCVSFGAVSKSHLKSTEVEKEVFAAEFDFDALFKSLKKNKILFKEIPKHPSVRRDLSLLIDHEIQFGNLKSAALKSDKKLLKEVQIFDVYQGDKLPEGKKSYALSFILQDELQTLSEKQIESTMQKIIRLFEKDFGAEIRKN